MSRIHNKESKIIFDFFFWENLTIILSTVEMTIIRIRICYNKKKEDIERGGQIPWH